MALAKELIGIAHRTKSVEGEASAVGLAWHRVGVHVGDLLADSGGDDGEDPIPILRGVVAP